MRITNMKKTALLLALVMMLFALCGCGAANTDQAQPSGDSDASQTDPAAPTGYVAGTVDPETGIYTNEFFGFKLTLPEDLRFLTEEEQAAEYGSADSEFWAEDESNSAFISMTVYPLSDEARENLTEEIMAETLQSDAAANVETEMGSLQLLGIGHGPVTLGGTSHEALDYACGMPDTDYTLFNRSVCMIKDGYYAILLLQNISPVGQNRIMDMMGCFSPL